MAPSPAGETRPRDLIGRSQAFHAAVLFAVGLALRLNGLGRHPIWLDEANSIHMASRPILSIPGVLQQDTAPHLYYMLLHYWQLAWEEGPEAVRSLSVIFGVLWIPAVFGLASRVGGRRQTGQPPGWLRSRPSRFNSPRKPACIRSCLSSPSCRRIDSWPT